MQLEKIKLIGNARSSQLERVIAQLTFLAQHYHSRGVYNTYWFYLYGGGLQTFWRRLDYREGLARTMRRARHTGLLKKHGPKKIPAETLSAKAP